MEFSTLIQQPESLRDENWEKTFLDAFTKLKVEVEGDQAQAGPDGFPYLKIKTTGAENEPVIEIIRWLATRGIGLAVNAHKMVPDYVFTYGMIWNFAHTGWFITPNTNLGTSGKIDSANKELIMGSPSDKYLPEFVRAILRQFLSAHGFKAPKVLVITTPDYKETDLAFSLESLSGLPEAEHKPFAERLSWFLPLHYSLVLTSENGLPSFTAL